MSLWLPPCSLIPSTSLHLPTLLLCTLSNVTLFDTQGWRPGRRADRDLAYWDVCFIIDCLIQNLSSDENTPDSPGSFLEACCQFIPIYTVVHWSLRPVEHIVWVFTFIERRFNCEAVPEYQNYSKSCNKNKNVCFLGFFLINLFFITKISLISILTASRDEVNSVLLLCVVCNWILPRLSGKPLITHLIESRTSN